jgi:hypothetical protein
MAEVNASRLDAFRGGASGWLAAVHTLPQLLACLEERDRFLVNRHGFPGPGIAARPSVAVLDREGAESSKFHSLAARQGYCDLVENGCDNPLHVLTAQVWVRRRELGDQF